MTDGSAERGSAGNVLVSRGIVVGVAVQPSERCAEVKVKARRLEWGFKVESEGVEEGRIVFVNRCFKRNGMSWRRNGEGRE